MMTAIVRIAASVALIWMAFQHAHWSVATFILLATVRFEMDAHMILKLAQKTGLSADEVRR